MTISDSNLRINFSGRYMYGKSCVGIVGDSMAPIRLIDYLRTTEMDLAKMLLSTTGLQDGFGRQFVFYWPGVSVERP